MTWQAGYFADDGYTYGTYYQQFPSQLYFSALLAGHQAFDLSSSFSYLDLGCGQGFNTCLMAAIHPQARFVGVDFLPEHIAHAKGLAEAAGLTNVSFMEADFRDIARQAPQDWPEFDLAAAHGIASWVSLPVRSALLQAARNCLKPGGLLYVSYNTFPGWLSTVPFQHLVSSFQRQCLPGQPSLAGAFELIGELKDAGAVTFASYPGLSKRLEQIKQVDPAYLVQEYNNKSWQPLFVDQMIQEASEAKLTYLSTADIPLLFDGIYPEPYRKLLRQQQANSPMRELTRDLLLNQSFRRDIYVKGKKKVWQSDQIRMLDQILISAITLDSQLNEAEAFTFTPSVGKIRVNDKLYRELMGLLVNGPQTIRQLRVGLAHHFTKAEDSIAPMSGVLLPVSLLISKRMVSISPGQEVDRSAAIRLNAYLASASAAGAPYQAISLPLAATVYHLSREELFVLDTITAGLSGEELVDRVLNRVANVGSRSSQDQSLSDDPSARRQQLAKKIDAFLGQKYKLICRLGGWN